MLITFNNHAKQLNDTVYKENVWSISNDDLNSLKSVNSTQLKNYIKRVLHNSIGIM